MANHQHTLRALPPGVGEGVETPRELPLSSSAGLASPLFSNMARRFLTALMVKDGPRPRGGSRERFARNRYWRFCEKPSVRIQEKKKSILIASQVGEIDEQNRARPRGRIREGKGPRRWEGPGRYFGEYMRHKYLVLRSPYSIHGATRVNWNQGFLFDSGPDQTGIPA